MVYANTPIVSRMTAIAGFTIGIMSEEVPVPEVVFARAASDAFASGKFFPAHLNMWNYYSLTRCRIGHPHTSETIGDLPRIRQ